MCARGATKCAPRIAHCSRRGYDDNDDDVGGSGDNRRLRLSTRACAPTSGDAIETMCRFVEHKSWERVRVRVRTLLSVYDSSVDLFLWLLRHLFRIWLAVTKVVDGMCLCLFGFCVCVCVSKEIAQTRNYADRSIYKLKSFIRSCTIPRCVNATRQQRNTSH